MLSSSPMRPQAAMGVELDEDWGEFEQDSVLGSSRGLMGDALRRPLGLVGFLGTTASLGMLAWTARATPELLAARSDPLLVILFLSAAMFLYVVLKLGKPSIWRSQYAPQPEPPPPGHDELMLDGALEVALEDDDLLLDLVEGAPPVAAKPSAGQAAEAKRRRRAAPPPAARASVDRAPPEPASIRHAPSQRAPAKPIPPRPAPQPAAKPAPQPAPQPAAKPASGTTARRPSAPVAAPAASAGLDILERGLLDTAARVAGNGSTGGSSAATGNGRVAGHGPAVTGIGAGAALVAQLTMPETASRPAPAATPHEAPRAAIPDDLLELQAAPVIEDDSEPATATACARALRRCRSLGDRHGEADLQRRMAGFARADGRLRDGLRHLQAALADYQAVDDDYGAASVLLDIGRLNESLGQPDAARGAYDAANRMLADLTAGFGGQSFLGHGFEAGLSA